MTDRAQVAVVGHRVTHDAGPDDLYPDADWPFLAASLARAGIEATRVSWDDPGVNWARFELALINSTWDSVDRPDAYLAWVRRAGRATVVLNPPAAVEWNLDKTYLRALAERGIAVVPTTWVTGDGDWAPPAQDFVVKPSISAGGRDTRRYRPEDHGAAEAHIRRITAAGGTAMVQPYLASVEDDGEVKLVFIDGVCGHAFRVGPQLVAGKGMPIPFGHIPVEPRTPSPAQLAAALPVLAALQAEIGAPVLYARVDLVAGPTGEQLLGEVELIDPCLFLRLAPASAERLAGAIRARAHR